MTPPFRADLEWQAAAPLTSPPPLLDDDDETWGFECAFTYLQGVGAPLESGTDACLRDAWR